MVLEREPDARVPGPGPVRLQHLDDLVHTRLDPAFGVAIVQLADPAGHDRRPQALRSDDWSRVL